jgi:hypothetical protein
VIAKMLGYFHVTQTDGSALALQKVMFAPIKALPIAAVNASLLFAILFNLFMLAIAYIMWKKRWFIKV